MYSNLLHLSKLTASPIYEDYANKLNSAFKKNIEQSPTASSQFLSGLTFDFSTSYEIIIVGDIDDVKTKEMIKAINSKYIPNKVVLLIDTKSKRDRINKLAPFTKDYVSIDDEPTVYVCKNYVCNLPTSNIDEMLLLLEQ